MKLQLFYFHDPMCSWCWAFSPALKALEAGLDDKITRHKILGGLAKDTDEPMATEMRETLINTWQRIQKIVPETQFNFDFWTSCQPKRSTWIACRAVLSAAHQQKGEEMNKAIQHAYYINAKNPSDEEVLIELAENLKLSTKTFKTDLNSTKIHQELQQQMDIAKKYKVQSFPSLVLDIDGTAWPISIDYKQASNMLDLIETLIEF